MRTPIHLLAIAGLGLVLATGHAIVRTEVFGTPAVTLGDVPAATGTNKGTAHTKATEKVTTGPDATSPDPTDGAPDQTATPDTAVVPALDAPVLDGQITLGEAFELFAQGAIFLDARNEDDFNAGHIEGAIWMPASRANTSDGQRDLDTIPPGDIVVIYCTGGDCDASHNTQRRIALLQYDFDVRILGKGYVDWLEAALPVTIPGSEDAGEGGRP